MNGYYDTDMALKLRTKVNTNNLIDVVTKSQEMRLYTRFFNLWSQKQYLNSLYGLYGMWCCVRHGKSNTLKNCFLPNKPFICSP